MPIHVEAAEPSPFRGRQPGTPLGGGLQVTLGKVVFGVVDGYGVSLHLAGLKGWWDPPATTGTIEQRASDHGGWLSPAYMQPRVVEVTARLKGSRWEHLEQTINDIIESVPLAALEQLVVDDHGTVRVAWVRQEGAPIITRKGMGAEVSLSLVAPDPRKYSSDVTTVSTGLPQTTGGLSLPLSLPLSIGATVSSGVLVASNNGTTATRPTLRVYGPTPADASVTHRGTGRSLRIPDAVPAGRFLLLDTDKRQAHLDADRNAARLVTGSWFEYAPGDNEVAFSASAYNPDAVLVSEHRHAWR